MDFFILLLLLHIAKLLRTTDDSFDKITTTKEHICYNYYYSAENKERPKEGRYELIIIIKYMRQRNGQS